MIDLALLVLRLATGGLVAGHGAQKLFGWFQGHGLEGTAGFMEKLGLRPGRFQAGLAGATEVGSGMLTAAGLGGPIGPIAMLAPLTVASRTAHRGRPLWATHGGPELAVSYAASATALALAGPGRYSADRLLRIRVPWQIAVVTAAVTAGAVAWTILEAQPQPPAEQPEPRAD